MFLLWKAAPKPLQRERHGCVHRTGSCVSRGWKVFLLAVMVVATWQPRLILEVFRREIDWSIILYVLTPRTDTYFSLNGTLSHSSLCTPASFSCSQRQSWSLLHLNLPSLARLVSTERSGLLVFKWSESCSVVSDSLRPHGLYSAWNSPGQNTGVGSLSLLQGICPTQVSLIASRFITSWATREAQGYWSG